MNARASLSATPHIGLGPSPVCMDIKLLRSVLELKIFKAKCSLKCASRRHVSAAAENPQISRGRSGAPTGGDLRVPSSKELQKMRQYRQQQQFRQQRVLRQQQRLSQGIPQVPPGKEVKRQIGSRSRSCSPKGKRKESQGNKKGNASLGQKREDLHVEVDDGMTVEEFDEFAKSHGFERSWRAQISILSGMGFSIRHLAKVASSRPEIFQTSPKTMKRKLLFFEQSVGMTKEQIVKVVHKFPRILEYGSEQTVKPRLEFLSECGVQPQNIAKIISKSPMIMSLSLSDTLSPRASFLKEELGLNKANLGKLISRHPQVLTCTKEMMQLRVDFLLAKAGIKSEDLGKVVVAHPQVLHYKIDSMLERLEYLSSVGMTQEQISQAVSRFPQVFSLSVATNMGPKWHYLVEHLGGDVQALVSYPGYFSLSLPNRIMMRHLYLQKVNGAAPLPFPLGHLKITDKKFACEIAGTSLSEYEAFQKSRESGQDSINVQHESEEIETEESDAEDMGLGNCLDPRGTLSNVLTLPNSRLNLV
eukprot:jgi/Picsp_1/5787/NSC_03146-R1_protein